MSSGDKKVAALLIVVLFVLVAIYFATKPKEAPPGAAATGTPTAASTSVQEFGKAGAKLEITALVPVVNPCHAKTVAALKQAYEKHPDEIHMTLIDFFGPQAEEWKSKLGVTCATVSINGKYAFEVDGKPVTFQKAEGASYKPENIGSVIEAELKKAG